MKLKGKKTIITGANQGFGLALAEAFLEQGADLFLGARNTTLLEKEAVRLRTSAKTSQQVITSVLDIADSDSISAFMRKAEEQWGKLDILINNAGVYGPKGALEEINWQEWVDSIRINLLGTVAMCRAGLPLLKKSEHGKIINLSGGGATAPLPRLSSYAASKAAVVRFTETLAEELKDTKIDVNAIAPGALNTRLLDEIITAGPAKVGKNFYDKSLEQKAKGGTPLTRGTDLCVYLAGYQSNGITGKLISAVWDPWEELDQHSQDLKGTDVYTLRRIIPKDRNLKWERES